MLVYISLGTVVHGEDGCCGVSLTRLPCRVRNVGYFGRKFLFPKVAWSQYKVIFGLLCDDSLIQCQLPFHNIVHTGGWLFVIWLAWNPVIIRHEWQCLVGRSQLAPWRAGPAIGRWAIGHQNIA